MPEIHEMVLEENEHEGSEIWMCPICGRRLLIEWNPWHREVLDQGDVHAAHSASKGGLHIGGVDIHQG